MRKTFKFLILFFLLLYSISFSVSAEETIPNDGRDGKMTYDFSVCGTRYGDCDFTTLDKALSYLEQLHFRDMESNKKFYVIVLFDEQEQVLTNHTLDVPIFIVGDSINKGGENFEPSRVIIDGKNSTIHFNYVLRFIGSSVSISNLNYVYHANIQSEYEDLAIDVRAQESDFNNVHITNTNGEHFCETMFSQPPFYGISFGPLGPLGPIGSSRSYVSEYNFLNSSISGFDLGIVYYSGYNDRVTDSGMDTAYRYSIPDVGLASDGVPMFNDKISAMINIDQSDLYDNLLSFYFISSNSYMTISNSKLTSFLALGSTVKFLEGNSFGDSKLMNVSLPDLSQIADADAERQKFVNYFCQNVKDKKKAIILKYNDTEKYPTVIEINLEKTEHVNDTGTKISVLDRFIDTTSTDISLFEYKVSDDSVAKMENGNVVLLKNQDVDVVARNRSTNEVYTLHLRMNRSLFQNPVTGTFIVLIIFGILFVISLFFIQTIHKKSHK